MNLNNCSNKNLEQKLSFDNKANLHIKYKNFSDNSLSNIFLNQFNKSLFTGVNQISELSTKISMSSLKKKNSKIRRRIGINVETINSENATKVVDNKKKAFEALENLLLNDIINECEDIYNNDINKNFKEEKNDFSPSNNSDNININEKKSKKSMSIPKLDFSNIINHYKKKPLYIKEVKYVSNFLIDGSDIVDSSGKIQQDHHMLYNRIN